MVAAQVLQEIAGETMSQLATAPTRRQQQQQQQQHAEEEVEEDDDTEAEDLRARLAAVRG